MSRIFEDRPAVREPVPLLLGIVGASSSGKTFSALRLAAGMQRVMGGEIFFVDTEGKRGTHHADRFKYRYVPFEEPFGPLDYLAVIEHCVARGAKILIIDSMTHEHSGPGGVMDQADEFLDKQCGTDWQKRQKLLMLSLIRPKAQRKKLNAAIVRLGINAIFCYRASEKIKPVKGEEPLKLGWQPETTSPLHYEMTQRFLLTPGCEGVPSFFPDTDAEKCLVKNPIQFRHLFKPGVQLNEDIGQAMAEWAAGPGHKSPTAELLARYEACRTRPDWDQAEKTRADLWKQLGKADQQKAKAASDATAKRLAEAKLPAEPGVADKILHPKPVKEFVPAGHIPGIDDPEHDGLFKNGSDQPPDR